MHLPPSWPRRPDLPALLALAALGACGRGAAPAEAPEPVGACSDAATALLRGGASQRRNAVERCAPLFAEGPCRRAWASLARAHDRAAGLAVARACAEGPCADPAAAATAPGLCGAPAASPVSPGAARRELGELLEGDFRARVVVPARARRDRVVDVGHLASFLVEQVVLPTTTLRLSIAPAGAGGRVRVSLARAGGGGRLAEVVVSPTPGPEELAPVVAAMRRAEPEAAMCDLLVDCPDAVERSTCARVAAGLGRGTYREMVLCTDRGNCR